MSKSSTPMPVIVFGELNLSVKNYKVEKLMNSQTKSFINGPLTLAGVDTSICFG